jgi:hypothetical protein
VQSGGKRRWVAGGHELGAGPLRLAHGDVVLDPIGVGIEVLKCVGKTTERGAGRWSIDEV